MNLTKNLLRNAENVKKITHRVQTKKQQHKGFKGLTQNGKGWQKHKPTGITAFTQTDWNPCPANQHTNKKTLSEPSSFHFKKKGFARDKS